MTTKRTTVTADRADLETLEAEAARLGVSLADVMRAAVREKARDIRRRRRPRVGIARSRDGQSAADVTADPVGRPPR